LDKGVLIGSRRSDGHGDGATESNNVPTYSLKRSAGESAVERLNRGVSQGLRALGYGLPLYRQRLKGRHPLQLLASPNDPVGGDIERGMEILSGKLVYGGEDVSLISDFLWEDVARRSEGFIAYVHGFRWLNDLAAVPDQAEARRFAENIIQRWVDKFDLWHPVTWTPDLTGSRLINWIVHAPLTLASSDLIYRSAVLNKMAHQARHLSRTLRDSKTGLPSVKASAGLAVAGLLLPGADALQSRGIRTLELMMEHLILSDGGPLTRVPSDAVQIMRLLVIIKFAYREVSRPTPAWVQVTLDRLAPFVRGMRHGDGLLARFNGASEVRGACVDSILAASDARGRAVENASNVGYQRLKKRRTTVIMDTGAPTAGDMSLEASAGTLSFELSDGKDPLVVNMGTANPVGEFAAMARLGRTTAAHSTLVIDDKNSTRINEDGRLGYGVNEVQVCRRETTRDVEVAARHDGYGKVFDCLHERILSLAADGRTLTGEDRVVPLGPEAKDRVAEVRFHLHPSVKAVPIQNGEAIIIRLPSGHGWQFRVSGGRMTLVDDLFMAAPYKPVRSTQIVATLDGGNDMDTRNLLWSFERIDESPN